MSTLTPKKIKPVISGECGGPFLVEAWRYASAKYQEVYVSVKDASGQWVQITLVVPR